MFYFADGHNKSKYRDATPLRFGTKNMLKFQTDELENGH